MECGGQNVNGPHKLIGRGTIKRHGFVGEGVALLVEVYQCGGEPWGIIYAQAIPSDTVHFLLPTGQDVRLSAPSPA